MDDHIGKVIELLKSPGIFEDTLIVISADHGEDQGELNVYGDHHTADMPTSNVPMIVHGPGVSASRQQDGFMYHLDLGPTLLDLLGHAEKIPAGWDGESFAGPCKGENWTGRESVVFGQGAWSAQRSVRWSKWLYIRTYHKGLHEWPDEMLFEVEADPHQTNNLAEEKPEVCQQAKSILQAWIDQVSLCGDTTVSDPFVALINEGGPTYVGGRKEWYMDHLKNTGREAAAKRLNEECSHP